MAKLLLPSGEPLLRRIHLPGLLHHIINEVEVRVVAPPGRLHRTEPGSALGRGCVGESLSGREKREKNEI